ncbi:hypothetical protein EV401DRAFT_427518 [Pisolithus croceorrhizus]|nr:hypothetical protein EV401DRAFT_427518 [Pisolithus croceorrhizus]
MLWRGAMQVILHVPLIFDNGIVFLRFHFSDTLLKEFVNNFLLHELLPRHGYPRRVRVRSCRGVGGHHVIWHNNSSGTYLYFMYHSEDGLIMKLVVAAVWIFDTLHVSFVCHMLYYYLIVNYGVPASLEYIIWSFPASVLANSIVSVLVQCFFARKIYYLCRRKLRWLVTAPIILLVLARIGFGIETLALMFVNDAVGFASSTRFYGSVPTASADPLAEVLITVSLCVLLYDSGSRSTFPRTKRLVNTLIIYSVNRCLLILPVVIAELAMAITEQAAWSMALNFIMGKLYANSLLASLNTRQHLRSQESSVQPHQCDDVIRFAKPRKFSEDVESSNNGGRHINVPGRL